MWQVQLAGKWQNFDGKIGRALVEAKARGALEYQFDMKGTPMLVDLRTMEQINVKTGKKRPVRETAALPRKRSPDPAPARPAPSRGAVRETPLPPPPAREAIVAAADDVADFVPRPAMGVDEVARFVEPAPVAPAVLVTPAPVRAEHDSRRADGETGHGGVHSYPTVLPPTAYIHVPPSAPPSSAASEPKVAPKPSPPKSAKAEPAEKPKKCRFGFKTGMAVGMVGAAGAGVGVGLATGVITEDDLAGAVADAGEALTGAAEDVGDAIYEAADDVADFVTGAC